jgi:hypothetical protein
MRDPGEVDAANHPLQGCLSAGSRSIAARNDGVEYLGTFELSGDTLKWCVGNRG